MRTLIIAIALLVTQGILIAQTRNIIINGAEWFKNTDPGEGNGHEITNRNPQAGLSIDLKEDKIDVSVGDRIYFRVKNERNVWSKPVGITYNGYAWQRNQVMSRAERFVGLLDPGNGNGIDVTRKGNFPNNPVNILMDTIPVAAPTDVCFTRMKNSGGHWSWPVGVKLGTNFITDVNLFRIRYRTPRDTTMEIIPISFTTSLLEGLIRSAATIPYSKCQFELGDTLVIKMKGRNEIWGPYATVIMGVRELKVSRPDSLTVTNISDATPKAHLSWIDSSGDCGDGFIVERKEQSGFSWNQVGTTPAKVAVFDDNNTASPQMVVGRTYCWRVKAKGRSEPLNSDFTDQACLLITEAEETPRLGNISLSQNYPNPFSSSTTITYKMLSSESVTLTVHDILGREVMRLVNGEMKTPGTYQLNVFAAKLTPGVYSYRLSTNDKTLTRMMIVTK